MLWVGGPCPVFVLIFFSVKLNPVLKICMQKLPMHHFSNISQLSCKLLSFLVMQTTSLASPAKSSMVSEMQSSINS